MSIQDFSDNLSILSYETPSRCPKWLYNRHKKTFLGRTCDSWGLCILIFECSCLAKILAYYVCFYSFLAGFFLSMLMIFLQFIVQTDMPMRTGNQSLLGFAPGVAMRPIIDEQRTLIHYSNKDPQDYFEYVDNLNALLDYYEEISLKDKQEFADCSGPVKKPNIATKVCQFPLSTLGACSRANDFGYPENKPCVMLKLNRVCLLLIIKDMRAVLTIYAFGKYHTPGNII
ncbi:unnamed protein product [Dibothriocephalus latus]|uniref:Sodium/potassium-transporting ATPase subunit beta n=1 Tax=Dibothriocephalus latus TaxID=60516 RepID=A0A3P7LH95_DIBLA|nr:unnamed protein product [Dibothriocephalus latus]